MKESYDKFTILLQSENEPAIRGLAGSQSDANGHGTMILSHPRISFG